MIISDSYICIYIIECKENYKFLDFLDLLFFVPYRLLFFC